MAAISPLYITFSVYILLMVGIGFAAWRYTQNLGDYILCARRLCSYVTAMSAGASDMSGWLLLGLPGAIYADCLSPAWVALGLVLGSWAHGHDVGVLQRWCYEFSNTPLTLPTMFNQLFEETG